MAAAVHKRANWEPLTSPWSSEFDEQHQDEHQQDYPVGAAPVSYSAGRSASDANIALACMARSIVASPLDPATLASAALLQAPSGGGTQGINGELVGGGKLIYDRPGGSERRLAVPQCVVLGVQMDDDMHFIMLVAPIGRLDAAGVRIYERIGAGYLPRDCIDKTGERRRIKIHFPTSCSSRQLSRFRLIAILDWIQSDNSAQFLKDGRKSLTSMIRRGAADPGKTAGVRGALQLVAPPIVVS